MGNLTALRAVQAELAAARAKAEQMEEYERQLTRTREALNRELKALGFHDVGHARTELGE